MPQSQARGSHARYPLRTVFILLTVTLKIHRLRSWAGQYASLLPHSEEMVDKEIVKIMYIDEPEILEQAIAKLPKNYCTTSTHS